MQTIVYTTAEYEALNDEQHIILAATRDQLRHEVTQALAEYAGDYDIDAILDECAIYIETITDEDRVLAHCTGFVARQDIDPYFDDAAFWAIVARCEK